jgi:hypothetical protein
MACQRPDIDQRITGRWGFTLSRPRDPARRVWKGVDAPCALPPDHVNGCPIQPYAAPYLPLVNDPTNVEIRPALQVKQHSC